MAVQTPPWKRGPNQRLRYQEKALTRPLNKAFEWPKSPSGGCDANGMYDPKLGATFKYDPNTKPTPGVSVAGAPWQPITEYAEHATFMADACDPANEAGFIDWVYRTSYPGTGYCPDDNQCDNVTVYQSVEFYFELDAPTMINPGDKVEWAVDPQFGHIAPFHGTIIPGGATGFQIKEICCQQGCAAATGVWAVIDFTKNSCP